MKKDNLALTIIFLLLPFAVFSQYESKTQKLVINKFNYNIFSKSASLSENEWNSIKNEYLIYFNKNYSLDTNIIYQNSGKKKICSLLRKLLQDSLKILNLEPKYNITMENRIREFNNVMERIEQNNITNYLVKKKRDNTPRIIHGGQIFFIIGQSISDFFETRIDSLKYKSIQYKIFNGDSLIDKEMIYSLSLRRATDSLPKYFDFQKNISDSTYFNHLIDIYENTDMSVARFKYLWHLNKYKQSNLQDSIFRQKICIKDTFSHKVEIEVPDGPPMPIYDRYGVVRSSYQPTKTEVIYYYTCLESINFDEVITIIKEEEYEYFSTFGKIYKLYEDELNNLSKTQKHKNPNVKITNFVLLDKVPSMEEYLISKKLESMIVDNRIPTVTSEIDFSNISIFSFDWCYDKLKINGLRQYSFFNFFMNSKIFNNLMFSFNMKGLSFKEYYNNPSLNSFYVYDISPGFCLPIFITNNYDLDDSKITTNQNDEITLSSTIDNSVSLRFLFGNIELLGYAPKNTFLNDIVNLGFSIKALFSVKLNFFNLDVGTSYFDKTFYPYMSIKFSPNGGGTAFSKLKF